MKKIVILAALFFLFAQVMHSQASKEQSTTHPAKGMVTMEDLGAKTCIPCKMMAPILAKLEKEYKGKAAIVFIDVREDPAAAKRFAIRAIPTQIFFDKKGQEVRRHEGFMSEKDIIKQLSEMGVK